MSVFKNLSFALRHALERVSRHVYFTRRLPARFGSIRLRVSPNASLSYYRGFIIPDCIELYDFAEHYVCPGYTVWDIGANMGVFTFAAAACAKTSGRVLSFEPDIWSVRLIKHSCTYNRGLIAEVDVLPLAVSNELSLEWLNIPERCRAGSHLASAGGSSSELIGGIRERHLVPVVTLDWVATQYPTPQVIKIDVDGAEHKVLFGGRSMLQRCKPVILVEVYERNADAVTSFLHELGYTLFEYEAGEKGKRKISRAGYNTLALPEGR